MKTFPLGKKMGKKREVAHLNWELNMCGQLALLQRTEVSCFWLRMFTGRESHSVEGDKAGLSADCDFLFATKEGFIS